MGTLVFDTIGFGRFWTVFVETLDRGQIVLRGVFP